MSRWIMASEERVTETYSDLQGPLTKEEYERGGRRIAALVALCEEVLDIHDECPRCGYHEPDADYRERLAKLRGEG
jgi:hypothetical protein